tara:strand:- start:597 stop:935 length:339 start_codon:yes stop_codon:yes gene_type:complete
MKYTKCVNVDDQEARNQGYQIGQQGKDSRGQEYRLGATRIITSKTGQLRRVNEWVHIGSVNKAKYLKDAHLEQFYPEKYKLYKMRSNGTKDVKDIFYRENPRSRQFRNPANL